MTKFPSKSELERVRNKLGKGPASRPLPKNERLVEGTKFRLCKKIVIYKNSNNLTQRSLSQKIGILMSKILHYHFDEFTTDRLIKYLSKIYAKIDVKVDVVA